MINDLFEPPPTWREILRRIWRSLLYALGVSKVDPDGVGGPGRPPPKPK